MHWFSVQMQKSRFTQTSRQWMLAQLSLVLQPPSLNVGVVPKRLHHTVGLIFFRRAWK